MGLKVVKRITCVFQLNLHILASNWPIFKFLRHVAKLAQNKDIPMAHIWVRSEQRAFEQRVGLTPKGAGELMAMGHRVTIEHSSARAIGIDGYEHVGCTLAPEHSWVDAPDDAIIFGLKELNENGPDLRHQHIMFGHAFKGQADGPTLLRRFKRGGGTLFDLEYLTNPDGGRVAAFGYWAGFAGAAIGTMAMAAQKNMIPLDRVEVYKSKNVLVQELKRLNLGESQPSAIIIGAKGRVGCGATDLLQSLGFRTALWDIDETKQGGPFPEILEHDLFVNCILAGPNVPVFVPKTAIDAPRDLQVIADVSCDPDSTYNPIPIYDRSTTFASPLFHVPSTAQPLDVMAIDNLPSMLPVESSEDFGRQLLPYLKQLEDTETGVWSRAENVFRKHVSKL
jgi:saccharopine dehydrogenase (NAD+, L-lysine-forming)